MSYPPKWMPNFLPGVYYPPRLWQPTPAGIRLFEKRRLVPRWIYEGVMLAAVWFSPGSRRRAALRWMVMKPVKERMI